jgi:hypothetical protein
MHFRRQFGMLAYESVSSAQCAGEREFTVDAKLAKSNAGRDVDGGSGVHRFGPSAESGPGGGKGSRGGTPGGGATVNRASGNHRHSSEF